MFLDVLLRLQKVRTGLREEAIKRLNIEKDAGEVEPVLTSIEEPLSSIVEGTTEFHALPVLTRCMEAHDPSLNPLDLAGVTVFDAESDGPIPKFGQFFQASK